MITSRICINSEKNTEAVCKYNSQDLKKIVLVCSPGSRIRLVQLLVYLRGNRGALTVSLSLLYTSGSASREVAYRSTLLVSKSIEEHAVS